MNLREFTEAVDQTAENLNKTELLRFLHNIARKVPEENRSAFLEILGSIHEDATETATGTKNISSIKIIMKKEDEKEIRKEFSRLKEMFGRIGENELVLHADGYEDYSLGYGDNWVWEYEDPEKICKLYEEAGSLMQRCVNDGMYQTAVDLFEIFTETEVTVENDWEDFSMDAEELVEEHLVEINLTNLALYALYAVYQASEPEERAEKIYDCFSVPFLKNICLEDMLGLGREELQGLPEFWDSWIMLLSEKAGNTEGRLLKEAVAYRGGGQGMLETARLAYRLHPALYLEALKELEEKHDYSGVLEIGKEALGWSGSFVKCGIALFLLLLLKGEKWEQGCAQMAEKLLRYLDFNAGKYLCGTKCQAGQEKGVSAVKDMDLFRKCFQKWKSGYHLTAEQEQEYVSKLESLIDKRVKAIVSGQYRYHYGSVAALAAALGEVKESMGERGGKQKILQKYKEEFPRHSSFRAELRRYGMHEIKKGKH